MTAPTHFRRLLSCLSIISICAGIAHAGLIHRYSFKESAVKDSVGNIDGKLKGAAKITDGNLVLSNGDKSSSDEGLSYLEFNAPIIPKSGSVSIVVWFTAKEAGNFARVINFGDKQDSEGRAFIYFTPRNAEDMARAAISATDTSSKTFIDTNRLDDGKEHMVAVVIDGTAKKLHLLVDGKEPVAAEDLGDNTLDKIRATNNWIGRSSFDQDAGLTGSIHEFRVYDHAMSLSEAGIIFKTGPEALPAAQAK